MSYTNVFVIGTDGSAWLVDTGIDEPGNFDFLTSELSDLGYTWGQVSGVLLTHHHPDHTGLIPRIRRTNDSVRVLAHPGFRTRRPSRSRAREWFERVGAPEAYRDSYLPEYMSSPNWDHLSEVGACIEPLSPGDGAVDLDSIRIEALSTPGHTRDHLCFFLPHEGILFSGDHLLPDETPNVGLKPGREGNPLGDYLEGLNRLRDRSPRQVYPGHGHPGLDPDGRLEAIWKHHRQRLDEALEAMEAGGSTIWEIAQGIQWREGRVPFLELETRSKYLALSETLSHVEYLRVQGEVKRRGDRPYEFVVSSSRHPGSF